MTKINNFPILPNNENVIGIIGGGQLGKMIALSASKAGYKTHLYCPKGDNPAESVVNKITHGQWDEYNKLVEFSNDVFCATSEFENIPSKSLELLSNKTKVVPSSLVFRCAQIRSKEKEMALKSGFNTPKWFLIKNTDDLMSSIKELSKEAILKTNSLGYDGKGQLKIDTSSNIFEVWENLGSVECVLEEKLEFKREISLMYFKSLDGSEGFFPLSENYHENGILKKTSAPAYLNSSIEIELKTKAKKLAQNLNLYGVLTIELFETLDGNVVFNEIAPRPHNSFHWTMDGLLCSQFNQLIRCVVGMPFGNVSIINKWEMINILSENYKDIPKYLLDLSSKIYIYNKQSINTKRKLGHINRLLS